MIFIEYWQAVVRKFPHLGDETGTTTIKISSLKALMQQSHEHGTDHGTDLAKFREMQRRKDDPMTMFEELFRGKR